MKSKSRLGLPACPRIVLGILGLSGCSAAEEPLAWEMPEKAESALGGGRDRRPPTTPGNFRVTQVTPSSATLAWSPSSDDSGNFTYRITATVSGSPIITVPKTETSYEWTGLAPRNNYWFFIYAEDAAGNRSQSRSTSATTPADTTPPEEPVVSITGVGATYVRLAWSAVDDTPHVFYRVFQDGALYGNFQRNTSGTIFRLTPETSYSFSVQAYDYGPNDSPLSDPVTATTTPVNSLDVTPPTTPTNLRADTFGDGSGETVLRWGSSTDDFDPPDVIRYDTYVNGALAGTVFGQVGQTIVDGIVGIPNEYQVVATDSAGNASTPATVIATPQ